MFDQDFLQLKAGMIGTDCDAHGVLFRLLLPEHLSRGGDNLVWRKSKMLHNIFHRRRRSERRHADASARWADPLRPSHRRRSFDREAFTYARRKHTLAVF